MNDELQTRLDAATAKVDSFWDAIDADDTTRSIRLQELGIDPTILRTDSDVDDYLDANVVTLLIDEDGDETAEVEAFRSDADTLVRDFPGIIAIWNRE